MKPSCNLVLAALAALALFLAPAGAGAARLSEVTAPGEPAREIDRSRRPFFRSPRGPVRPRAAIQWLSLFTG
jgi:hypothetical protein